MIIQKNPTRRAPLGKTRAWIRRQFAQTQIALTALTLSLSAQAADVFWAKPDFAPRFENLEGTIHTVAPGADDKFYVGGEFSSIGDAPFENIARFNGDGSVDETFSPEINYPGIYRAMVRTILELSDGTTLVGGSMREFLSSTSFAVVWHLDPNGRLISQIGGPSKMLGVVLALTEMPDNKILVGGSLNEYAGQAVQGLILMDLEGTRDESFTPVFDSTTVLIEQLLAADNGKIYVSGEFTTGDQNNFARINADGTFDDSFNLAVQPGPDVMSFLTDNLGRLVMSGYYWLPGDTTAERILRVLPSGEIDDSFSIDGSLGHGDFRLALEEDDTILVAGRISWDEYGHARAFKILPDGTRDPNFLPDLANVPDFILSLENGRAIAADTEELLLLQPDGNTAAVFNDEVRSPGSVNLIKPLPDGRWFVHGNFSSVNGPPEGVRSCTLHLSGARLMVKVPCGPEVAHGV